jgi:hypothetical protein
MLLFTCVQFRWGHGLRERAAHAKQQQVQLQPPHPSSLCSASGKLPRQPAHLEGALQVHKPVHRGHQGAAVAAGIWGGAQRTCVGAAPFKPAQRNGCPQTAHLRC